MAVALLQSLERPEVPMVGFLAGVKILLAMPLEPTETELMLFESCSYCNNILYIVHVYVDKYRYATIQQRPSLNIITCHKRRGGG